MTGEDRRARLHTVRYPRRQGRAIVGGVLWTILFPIAFAAAGKLIGELMGSSGGPPSWLWAAIGSGWLTGWAISAFGFAAAGARPGTLRREGDRIIVDRRIAAQTIPMSEVDTGWTTKHPKGDVDRVGITLRSGETLVADVPAGEGQAKLAELGLDASKRRLQLSLWSTVESVLMGVAGGVLGMLAWLPLGGITADVLKRMGATDLDGPLVLATLLPMILLGALVMRRAKPVVTVGSDGVIVAGGSIRAKKRFYPLDRVASVDLTRGANARKVPETIVWLRMKDGSDAEIARFLSNARTEELAETIAGRVREAMAARDALPAAEASSLLDGIGDGVGAWLGSLKKLAAKGDGYRAAALTRDRLVGLVDDARAAVRTRIGAAVMLAEQGDTEGLARVRIAADACASPRVRVALEKVADRAIDEAAIADAIADEEADAPSAERAIPVHADEPA